MLRRDMPYYVVVDIESHVILYKVIVQCATPQYTMLRHVILDLAIVTRLHYVTPEYTMLQLLHCGMIMLIYCNIPWYSFSTLF